MRGHGSQWFSHKINNQHPLQLKKSNWAYFEVNGLDWQCCLAGSSQTAPRILIFSIAMGADYSFHVKTIETHARTFFKIIIFSISSVSWHLENNLL